MKSKKYKAKKAQMGTSIYGDPYFDRGNLDPALDILKSAGSAYLGNRISSQAYFNAIIPDKEEAKRRSQISAGVSGAIGGISAGVTALGQRRDYMDEIERIQRLQDNDYRRVPMDRYAYNAFLDNPYTQAMYGFGGAVGGAVKRRYQDGGEVELGQEVEEMEAPREQVTFDSTFDEPSGYAPSGGYEDYGDYDNNYGADSYGFAGEPVQYFEDEIPTDEVGVDWSRITPTLGDVPTRWALQPDDIENTISGIGQSESRGNYSLVNTTGGDRAINATGKYQFVPKYWHKEIASFQGTQGKSMEETMEAFKSSPEVQERFMRHVVNKYYLPEVKSLLPIARNYGIDQEGLIRMMHYRGIEDTKKRLMTGDFSVDKKEKEIYKNPDILNYIMRK